MDGIINAIFPCIAGRERSIQLPTSTSEQPCLSGSEKSTLLHGDEKTTAPLTSQQAADRIVDALFGASKGGAPLIAQINGIAHQAGGWSEWLADQTRKSVEVALESGKEMNAVLAVAYEKACEAAMVFEDFEKDHPLATAVFVTVIAIGVLVILAPYMVEILGFGELGPVEGEITMIRCVVIEGVF